MISSSVSVIIPCYNAKSYIAETLESIMKQTYPYLDIIVINDGSTDDTEKIVKKFGEKIRYFYQKNAGPAIARNRGILQARGDYLAFCDSDDIWVKEKLERQVAILHQYPECGITATNGFLINSKGEALNREMVDSIFPVKKLIHVTVQDMLGWAKFYPSATIVSKEAILQTGLLFDAKTYLFENVLMWLRIAERFEALFLNEPLVKRRYLENSLIHSFTKRDRYAQIKVFSLALTDFPDLKKDIKSNLAHSLYAVARLEVIDRNFKQGANLISRSLRINPFLGQNYLKKGDTIFQMIKKILAPFGLLLRAWFHLDFVKKNDW